MSEPVITTEDAVAEPKIRKLYIVHYPKMKANAPGKLNYGRTALLSVAFLAALTGLTYYNIAVPVVLDNLIPLDFLFLGFIKRKLFINALMTIDNILALSLQPLFGNMSDRAESRFGKRIPFMVIGVIGASLFFGISPLVQLLGYFVGMLVVYNVFMAFFRSPALSLVPDYTEEKLRSTASGLQQLIANIGTILAFGISIIIGLFIPTGSMGKDARDVLISRIGFPVASAIMLICLVILLLTIKETPSGYNFIRFSNRKLSLDPVTLNMLEDETPEKDRGKREVVFFKIFSKKYRSIMFLFFAILFWFMGFAAIEANFSLLGNEFFNLPQDKTQTLGLIYPVSMILASFLTGFIGRKVGRKITLYFCLISLIVCITIISAVIIPLGSVLGLAIMMGFVGVFWMGVIVNTFPVVWKLSPKNEISTFNGIYYTFNQTAAVLGPLFVGGIFDLLEPKFGLNYYYALFPFVLLCLIIALVFLIFVKGGEASDVDSSKGIEEDETSYDYEELEDYDDEEYDHEEVDESEEVDTAQLEITIDDDEIPLEEEPIEDLFVEEDEESESQSAVEIEPIQDESEIVETELEEPNEQALEKANSEEQSESQEE